MLRFRHIMWRAPYFVVIAVLVVAAALASWKFDLFSSSAPSAGTSHPVDASRSDGNKDSDQRGYDLAQAAAAGRVDQMRELLAAGADPDWGQDDPLMGAATRNHQDALDLLLKAGAHPQCTTLFGAVAAKNIDMVNQLLALGVRPDDGHCSALRRAVQDDQPAIARLLLARGADIHARIGPNDASDEPIEIARKQGNTAMTQLLEQGR